MKRNPTYGRVVTAMCAGWMMTVLTSEALALSCEVLEVRVTTHTMNYDGADCDDDGSTVAFFFGDETSWYAGYYLNNSGIEDYREGAIDEFAKTWTSPNNPAFPDDFERLKLRVYEYDDTWGLAGFKVEIKCQGSSSWYPIYINRGVNQELHYYSTNPREYETGVDHAGYDDYDGDHEVFVLVNIGDNGGDGVAEDLESCEDANDVKCRVRALVVNEGGGVLLEQQLTESWWDVKGSDYVNPLVHHYGEYWDSDVYTDNFWRWFYVSDAFQHNQVEEARLILDQCDPDVYPCSIQFDYLHATVMQSWGKQSYNPYPYFRSHIYEGDFTGGPSGTGWLEVTTGSDSVATTNERYYGFSGTNWRVEPWQDSEHTQQQMQTACGYMSLDMILSTRGFPYEDIPTDEPYAGADSWEEASAVAHLEWGYKTMCCGSWDCCDDVAACVSDIDLDTDTETDVCSAGNHTKWWRWDRCLYNEGNDQLCNRERYFWRDQDSDSDIDTSTDTNGERFPHLVNYDGGIEWGCQDGVDDDTDGETDEPDEFWNIDGIRCMDGSVNATMAHYLEEQQASTTVDRDGSSSCGTHPVNDDIFFGNTKSVWDCLAAGYGIYFGWNHKVGNCGGGGGSHWSVLDGNEKIYHPGNDTDTATSYDYLFFMSDPNSPFSSTPGFDFGYEGMDNIGLTVDDFESTVKGMGVWDHDFYQ